MRALSQTRRGPRRLWIWNGIGAAVIVALVVVIIVVARGSGANATTPPAATPAVITPNPSDLATLSAATTGAAIDGIQCQTSEQLVYHIHAHLAIYVNGAARTIPWGIGIAPPRSVVQTDEGPYVDSGHCFYWLHTHTGDGIIHIELPSQKTYTLGQFFDIWGQPLTTSQVGPATGKLIVYVGGKRFNGDPRSITLTAHELIQIDVGSDVPPQPFTFPVGY